MKLFSTGMGMVVIGAVLFLTTKQVGAEQKWKIHEWGTFTSLQDEKGEAIGGINTDDEPVPKFVHQLASFLLLRPTEMPAFLFQGAPRCHPDVTMRLETPVIYFHPPESETNIATVNVTVKFRGGWLTEFYPAAQPDVPGVTNCWDGFPHLYSSTESQLAWNNLKIGGNWPRPKTTAHVWTSPRDVKAASVQTTNGESDKFLFYRGVAHVNAPLKISRDTNSGELLFRSQLENLPTDKPLPIRLMWLVDIHKNGRVAFRELPTISLDRDAEKILTRTPANFKSDDFNSGNLEKLKTALKKALLSEGLFDDEAQALLNTWELSYFKSAGLRVFFIVPRIWTDFYLPLEISRPAEINRAMVGRIELITPEQRLGLQKIAGYTASEIKEGASLLWKSFYDSPAEGAKKCEVLASEERALSSTMTVPKTYQTYLDLGRFRNALILDEAKTRPAEGITNFISTYRLEAYKPQ